jgi:hypothetical protein
MRNFLKLSLTGLTVFSLLVGYSQQVAKRDGTGPCFDKDAVEYFQFIGHIKEVNIAECVDATQTMINATHIVVQTLDGKLIDVHLGPTHRVVDYVNHALGEKVALNVFTHEKLPENSYVAKELTIDGEMLMLRDEQLRPYWAKKKAKKSVQ